jgi:hypothetical protein
VEATTPRTSNEASKVETLALGTDEMVGTILGALAPTTGGRGIAAAGGGGGIEPALGGGGGTNAPAGLLSFNLGAELASPSEDGGGGGGGGGVSRLIVEVFYQVLEWG